MRENKDSTMREDESAGVMAHQLIRKASQAKEGVEVKGGAPEPGTMGSNANGGTKLGKKKSAELDSSGVELEEEYTFAASFWRLAAEKLVLKSQFEAMHQRKVEAGIASVGDVVIDRIGRSQTISLRHPFPEEDSDEGEDDASDPYSRKSISSNDDLKAAKKDEHGHVALVLDARTGRMSTPNGEHVELTTHVDKVLKNGDVVHSRTLPRKVPIIKPDPRRDTAPGEPSEGEAEMVNLNGDGDRRDIVQKMDVKVQMANGDGPRSNGNMNNDSITNGKLRAPDSVTEATRPTAPLMKTPDNLS